MKRENIALAVAILGAATGSIAFLMNIGERIKYRPRVKMDFQIIDFAKEKPRPEITAAVTYVNLGKSIIGLTEPPHLSVRILMAGNSDPTPCFL